MESYGDETRKLRSNGLDVFYKNLQDVKRVPFNEVVVESDGKRNYNLWTMCVRMKRGDTVCAQ